MSKKTNTLLGALAVAGAAAGIFCWYKKKHAEDDFVDEFDADFEEEFDAESTKADEFEIDDDLKDMSSRGYTTLTPSSETEANKAEHPSREDHAADTESVDVEAVEEETAVEEENPSVE